MNRNHKILCTLTVFTLLISALLVQPLPVLAALGITRVQPNVVSGLSQVDLVVTGTDFEDGAVVIVENFGALATSYVSASVLTAVLPPGIDPGDYTVTVVNPDSTSASLPNGLRVLAPTATSAPPQPTSPVVSRPVIVVASYTAGNTTITPGKPYDLVIKINNAGGAVATNIVAVFAPGDFVPTKTGGVQAVSELGPGETQRLSQPVTASYDVIGKSFATIVLTVSYTDPGGFSFSETFNLNLPVTPPAPGAFFTPTPTPTLTPMPLSRPQLVITGYQTGDNILQPGTMFELIVELQNKGNANAHQVSMIIGGGSSAPGVPVQTPGAGGVSGGSADLGNFAPVGSSNVQFLGDVQAEQGMQASAALIVNANTAPGAYPLKISFTYTDDKSNLYTDDQVVTLLVYSLPQLEVNFYRDPGPLFTGQPNVLPLQVVNIGRKSAVLGTMKVSGEGAQFSNSEVLVGPLDVGGYYTLDATAIPDLPGPLRLDISISYSDDFGQTRVFTDTLDVQVEEMMSPEGMPGEGGIEGGGEPFPPAQPETFLQKIWRFVLGLLGLNSGAPSEQPLPGELPPGEFPPGGEVPVPVQGAGPKG